MTHVAEAEVYRVAGKITEWENICYSTIEKYPLSNAYSSLLCRSLDDGKLERVEKALEIMRKSIRKHSKFYGSQGKFIYFNLHARYLVYRQWYEEAIVILKKMAELEDAPHIALDVPFQLWKVGFAEEVRNYFSTVVNNTNKMFKKTGLLHWHFLWPLGEERIDPISKTNSALTLRGDSIGSFAQMIEECFPMKQLPLNLAHVVGEWIASDEFLIREKKVIDEASAFRKKRRRVLKPPSIPKDHWLCYDNCWRRGRHYI